MDNGNNSDYRVLVDHYESCLAKYGDNHKGVDWPNKEGANKRYQVMLELFKSEPNDVTLLDFGCGTGHLLEYIHLNNLPGIEYSGLDISESFIKIARQKFPTHSFYCIDILEKQSAKSLPNFDFIVMNGVLTEKRSLSFQQMWNFSKELISTVFGVANKGIAFNVMSKHVDWEREDLFHLPFDLLADFLTKNISRHIVIRNDYGLYEYTVYVYKNSRVL